MDTDNDGIVSCEELKSGIAKFGSHLAESEVQMLIEAVSIAKNLNFILYSLFKKHETRHVSIFLEDQLVSNKPHIWGALLSKGVNS